MTLTTTSSENVARYVESLEQRRQCSGRSVGPEGVEPPDAEQAEVARFAVGELSTLGLIELLLKDQSRLDRLSRSPQAQRELVPRLLCIGLSGYAIFGVVLAIIFTCAGIWPELTPMSLWLESARQPLVQLASLPAWWQPWADGSVLHLVAAFAIGLMGAIGVCLPSFYFYGLLAGIQTSMLQVTTNALKSLASGAVAVLGALPIYLALVLGLIIFGASGEAVGTACLAGLSLPFIAGLYGTRTLYIGFIGLADTLPEARRCRRTCFLRRLLVAWSACYTAVTPVMIFTLWETMSR